MIDLIPNTEIVEVLLDLLYTRQCRTNSGKIKILIELTRLDYDISKISLSEITNLHYFMLVLQAMITKNLYISEQFDIDLGTIDDYTVHELEYIRNWASPQIETQNDSAD